MPPASSVLACARPSSKGLGGFSARRQPAKQLCTCTHTHASRLPHKPLCGRAPTRAGAAAARRAIHHATLCHSFDSFLATALHGPRPSSAGPGGQQLQQASGGPPSVVQARPPGSRPPRAPGWTRGRVTPFLTRLIGYQCPPASLLVKPSRVHVGSFWFLDSGWRGWAGIADQTAARCTPGRPGRAC